MPLHSNRVVTGLVGCVVCCAALLATPSTRADIYNFNFTLSGLNEVPPNASPGTGDCTVVVDDVLRTLQVDCTYSGLDGASTAAHVYVGQPGQSGVVLQTLSHSAATSGDATVSTTMLPGQLSQIIGGSTFIRIHSAAFPGGEIRGQIVNPPPPQSLFIFGIEHTALGAATLTARDIDDDGYPQKLIIDNIGASGNDGVELRLGPVNGGIERPGVQGCLLTIQHVVTDPLLAIQPRNVLKTYFETGDIPTEDQLIIDYDHLGALGSVSLNHSLDLPVQSLHIELRHNGQLVDANETPVPPAGALVTGTITEGEAIEFMDKAWLVDIVLLTKIVPIAMEKDLRFGSARMLSILGAPPVLADQIQIVVVYGSDDPTLRLVRMEMAAAANGQVHLHKEGLIHRDIACRALGDAHIVGSEECSTGVCEDALIVDNLGSSGNDGVSLRTIKSRAGNLITLDDRDHSKQISFLPITLADGDELTIGSEWCPANDAGDDCDFITTWCRVTGTAGGLTVDADFSGAGVTASKGYGRKDGDIVAADFNYSSSAITAVPGGTVQIISAADADHVTGQYMAGFIWKFAGDVQLEIPGEPPVLIDELQIVSAMPIKKEEGGRHTPFHNRWQPSGIGHAIVIKDVQPAHAKFTAGHLFGVEHTATNADMAIVGSSTTPIAVDVAIDSIVAIMDIAPGGDVHVRAGTNSDCIVANVHANPPQMARLSGAASGSSADIGEARMGGCPNPDDPLCAGAPPLGDGRYFAVDFTSVGVGQYLVEYVANGEVKQSSIVNSPPVIDFSEPPSIDVMFNPKEYTIKKVAPAGGGPGLALSMSMRLADALTADFILRSNGMLGNAQEVRVTSLTAVQGLEDLDAIRWSSGSPTLPLQLTVFDLAVCMFQTDHHAQGVAHILAVPPDPIHPAHLEIRGHGAQVSGIYSEKASFGGMTGIGHPNYAVAVEVDDPCAGLPPDCIGWPNDAAMDCTVIVSSDDLNTPGNNDPHVRLTLRSRFVTDGISSHVEVELDASAMGVTTYHLQMYYQGDLVDDVPDYSGPLQVSGRGGQNENWPFEGESHIGGASMNFTATFVDGRYILRSGVPLLTPVLCDELRFTVHPPNMALGGIVSSLITTRDLELVRVTDMLFGDPEPVCRADIAPIGGDGAVGVPDLLAIINAWGPCPGGTSCNADIAPAPDGDGAVGVPDLLAIINAWGPCE